MLVVAGVHNLIGHIRRAGAKPGPTTIHRGNRMRAPAQARSREFRHARTVKGESAQRLRAIHEGDRPRRHRRIPAASALTVAVNVTFSPNALGFAVDARATVVPPTVSMLAFEVLATKLLPSPL